MADKKLNEVTTVSDFDYFLGVKSNGDVLKMNKRDMAKVVEGLLPNVSLLNSGLMTSAQYKMLPSRLELRDNHLYKLFKIGPWVADMASIEFCGNESYGRFTYKIWVGESMPEPIERALSIVKIFGTSPFAVYIKENDVYIKRKDFSLNGYAILHNIPQSFVDCGSITNMDGYREVVL